MLNDEDIVIRYVHPVHVSKGKERLTSGLYKRNPESVDVMRLIEADGKDVREFVLSEIENRNQAGAVWIRVGEIRAANSNLEVEIDTSGSNGPYHAHIFSKRVNQNTGDVCKNLDVEENENLLSVTE